MCVSSVPGCVAKAERQTRWRSGAMVAQLRCNENGTDLSWLVSTDAVGQAYHILIHETKESPRPNFSNTANTYPHSTWSKAFSASRERSAAFDPLSYLLYSVLSNV
ncbi:hypothetical protein AAFF_G00348300 [Aldrovandia affinis]|uniref:Uncharacterized protein n=1 Tax=Aldrovandia affinis TaxID=143900 RepID=A0AAD7R667_9TELE|nr:hypothetical protein AAFF_G00348300 [Aldrovandia affinis]